MADTVGNALTFEMMRLIIPDAITLVDGLLFARFPRSSLDCTMLNEEVMIVGFEKSGRMENNHNDGK